MKLIVLLAAIVAMLTFAAIAGAKAPKFPVAPDCGGTPRATIVCRA